MKNVDVKMDSKIKMEIHYFPVNKKHTEESCFVKLCQPLIRPRTRVETCYILFNISMYLCIVDILSVSLTRWYKAIVFGLGRRRRRGRGGRGNSRSLRVCPVLQGLKGRREGGL